MKSQSVHLLDATRHFPGVGIGIEVSRVASLPRQCRTSLTPFNDPVAVDARHLQRLVDLGDKTILQFEDVVLGLCIATSLIEWRTQDRRLELTTLHLVVLTGRPDCAFACIDPSQRRIAF